MVLALSITIGWIAFVAGRPVPLLDWVDLAVHETGHLLAAFLPALVMFLAGSVAQVAAPAALAVYFWRQRDLAAVGFCMAWAGTSARDVSIYAGDAVTQALPLVGTGQHDWAYILGPNGFDALSHTAGVARAIEFFGLTLTLGGVAVAFVPVVAAWRGYTKEAAVKPFAEPVKEEADPWAAAARLPFKAD